MVLIWKNNNLDWIMWTKCACGLNACCWQHGNYIQFRQWGFSDAELEDLTCVWTEEGEGNKLCLNADDTNRKTKQFRVEILQKCCHSCGFASLVFVMSFEGASPPLNSSDDRTLRQRNRVRKKIQQRRPPEGYYPQPSRNPGRRRGGGGKTSLQFD